MSFDYSKKKNARASLKEVKPSIFPKEEPALNVYARSMKSCGAGEPYAFETFSRSATWGYIPCTLQSFNY